MRYSGSRGRRFELPSRATSRARKDRAAKWQDGWPIAPLTIHLCQIRPWCSIGGRRKKLDVTKRREIAESVITGRKSGAEMLDSTVSANQQCHISLPPIVSCGLRASGVISESGFCWFHICDSFGHWGCL